MNMTAIRSIRGVKVLQPDPQDLVIETGGTVDLEQAVEGLWRDVDQELLHIEAAEAKICRVARRHDPIRGGAPQLPQRVTATVPHTHRSGATSQNRR